MHIREDEDRIYIHQRRYKRGGPIDAVLSGQGWAYSIRLRAWTRANNEEGQQSLATVKQMLGINDETTTTE